MMEGKGQSLLRRPLFGFILDVGNQEDRDEQQQGRWEKKGGGSENSSLMISPWFVRPEADRSQGRRLHLRSLVGPKKGRETGQRNRFFSTPVVRCEVEGVIRGVREEVDSSDVSGGGLR
ncbi:unnamed protein product [Lactuca virosa]|uniref:Uncharacterized protein n=1 Tax=Lactuca virosa TaxID=75947 RepID=A0AAU9PV09_9ASTR|nr:unnamed protein product [Lactuca virosa]